MSLNNLDEIFVRKPYLKLYFSSVPAPGTNPFVLVQGKKENEFLVSLENTKLASGISPKTQAKRSLPEKGYRKTDLILVLGMGNPHLVQEIDAILPEGQIAIFIDYHLEIFHTLWDSFLHPVLSKDGRHIFCGENSLYLLWNYIDSLPIERISGIKYLRNPSSVALAPEFYKDIEERIHKIFSSKMSDLLTKFEFERIWVKNTLCNTIGFFRNPPYRFKIQSIPQNTDGIPGLLVSAGPSLRSHCSWIHSIRDKVFLLSCDTSLKVLLKFGIIPDAVMTLDAQTHSFFHFMGEDLSSIPVFADMVTSPALIRSLNTSSIVHSITAKFQVDASGKPIREVTAGSETAEEILGPIGDIQSGGSVATTAFDVLKTLGFSPIFLVGQDLAYTGREIHSTGTHHNEKWLTLVNRRQSLEKINEAVVRKRNTDYIPSCNGEKVLTDYVLKIYKQWFEESASNLDIPIYNVNSGGAYLEFINNINILEAKQIFKDISYHDYPWRKLPPWIGNLPIENSDHSSKMKDRFLVEINTLKKHLADLESPDNNTEFIVDKLKEKLIETPYMKLMLRKIEVYLKRHEKGLTPERKKEIFISALKKEIRFLKKGVLSEPI